MAGTGVLSGVLVGADGAPIAGVTVAARSDVGTTPKATSKTDAEGRFRLEGLTVREGYILFAEGGDGPRELKRLSLRKREQAVNITLPAGGPAVPTDTTTSNDTTVSGATNGGAPFDELIALIEEPALAPEPPVNIDEARELARLFVISMYLVARVPEAINRIFTARGANYQVGDLTLERMDQLSPDVQTRMRDAIQSRTEQFDTEEDLLLEIRAAFNLGTAAVPAVNSDFGNLFRRYVALASDDNNAVNPEEVKKEDPRQAAVIYNFLRDLKRSIMRLTQNMSVVGTLGTARLVEKWSHVMVDAIEVLRAVGENHVVSADKDDRSPWSVLAALTDTPRGTVKAYVVNARDGGHMLRLAVGIYEALQENKVPGAGGLDDESDELLRALFFAKGKDIFDDPLKSKVGDKEISVALKQPATLVRDYVAPLWP